MPHPAGCVITLAGSHCKPHATPCGMCHEACNPTAHSHRNMVRTFSTHPTAHGLIGLLLFSVCPHACSHCTGSPHSSRVLFYPRHSALGVRGQMSHATPDTPAPLVALSDTQAAARLPSAGSTPHRTLVCPRFACSSCCAPSSRAGVFARSC